MQYKKISGNLFLAATFGTWLCKINAELFPL